jgi:hypothetical protein
MAFTALAYTGGPAAIGSTIQVTAAADAAATEAYFFSVTGPVQAQLTRGTGPNFSVTIPEGKSSENGSALCHGSPMALAGRKNFGPKISLTSFFPSLRHPSWPELPRPDLGRLANRPNNCSRARAYTLLSLFELF